MTGRVNQKLRTRQALIDAATWLAQSGRALTIAEVADVARVSSATAYRYFSSPQELVMETVISRAPEVIADLPDDPVQRLDEAVRRLAELQLGDEALWRTVLGATLTRWSEQAGSSAEAKVPIRGQARLEITRRALAPLEQELDPDLHRRLTMSVMLVYGMEALVAARDACGLAPEEAVEVMRWAAKALLKAARDEASATRAGERREE
jgi:AcrR family transcriptional regulator